MTRFHKISEDLVVKLKGGASIVTSKPVISANKQYVICCCGDVLKVYSIASSLCVHVLKGHQDVIRDCVILNKSQILSCSQDGHLIKWNYEAGVRLATYLCPKPLTALAVSDKQLVAVQLNDDKTGTVVLFSLPEQETNIQNSHIDNNTTTQLTVNVVLRDVFTRSCYFSVGSKNGLVAACKFDVLKVCTVRKRKVYEWVLTADQYNKHPEFTCLAAHPTQSCVATGLNNGYIILWNGVTSKQSTRTILHWHCLPPLCVSFGPLGSYLLSGGHECVLVRWQMNSDHKDFRPRMGAPLLQLASSDDGTMVATGLGDNEILVLSGTLSLVQQIQGLTLGMYTKAQLVDRHTAVPVGLLRDPRTGAIVTNGKPGHLQFYDLNRDTQLYNLDIVGQNYIVRRELDQPIVITRVEHASFTPTGAWLVTVEQRDDGKTFPEQRMKFWSFDDQKQSYFLSTVVEWPHNGPVMSLLCRPASDELMFVTTSTDGQFKIWTLQEKKKEDSTQLSWMCDAVGYYREKPVGRGSFSCDGKLLAVVFDKTVTLWDPDTMAIQDYWALKHPIRNVEFCAAQYKDLLMVASDETLYCINVSSKEVVYELPCKVTCWSRCSISQFIAVFTENCEVVVFSPGSSKPVYVRPKLTEAPVFTAVFVPRPTLVHHLPQWLQASRLYYMTENQELLSLVSPGLNDLDLVGDDAVSLIQNIPDTPLAVLLKSNRPRLNQDIKSSDDLLKDRSEFLKEFLMIPCHAMPMLNKCEEFYDTLLPAFTKKMKVEDSDDDSSDEDEVNYGRKPSSSSEDEDD